jgi:raffinose/stachyose/melibiose transport system substrate-binding protein
LQFKGRTGIKEGLIPALDANQQVDLFDGQGNEGDYNMVTVAEVEKLAGGDGSGRIQR